MTIPEIAWGQDCSVSSTPINFGNYDMLVASPLNSTGSITVTCDPGIPYTIKLDQGQNSGGSFQHREMRSSVGGDTLRYNLYRNSSRTEIWGNGTGNTFIVPAVGTGGNQNFTVYGRIPGRQKVRTELYNDTVTVIIEW
jgi:spore coat protein U-like protein